MIDKLFFSFIIIMSMISASCSNSNSDKQSKQVEIKDSAKGSFGYDVQFLQQHDKGLVILKDASKESQIIVSPKYQAKVFTSTAEGNAGLSFGWVNYKAFGNNLDAHMNAYGGENRFWLGPEGGKFSLFFAPQTKMDFDHWKTPAAFDSEAWQTTVKSEDSVVLQKEMQLINYAGTEFQIGVRRKIKLLDGNAVAYLLGVTVGKNIRCVGYRTENTVTNNGEKAWDDTAGMPCIWILDMFPPSDGTTIVIPLKKGSDKPLTSGYFGEIPSDRLKIINNVAYLKADGRQRGKLGVHPVSASKQICSYDAMHKVLTVALFDVAPSAKYLNQEWRTDKPVFSGDAVNAYNDGPLKDGLQMGPFYEMESVSPGLALPPGHSATHWHSVFHFTGNENELNKIAEKVLGVSLQQIKQTF